MSVPITDPAALERIEADAELLYEETAAAEGLKSGGWATAPEHAKAVFRNFARDPYGFCTPGGQR